jgi:hypothetical protein
LQEKSQQENFLMATAVANSVTLPALNGNNGALTDEVLAAEKKRGNLA